MPRRLLILMGPRAAGKTTVATALAAASGCPCIDLDDRTAALGGFANPADALRSLGEPAFRAMECEALRHVLGEHRGRSGLVIALGGGTPVHPPSSALVKAARRAGAGVVYLSAPVASLRERLAKTDLASRPSLTGAGVTEEIEAVLASRESVYRALADLVVDTAGKGQAAVADEIRAWAAQA